MSAHKSRFICDICKHTFRDKKPLIIHIKNHEITNEKKEELYKKFKCPLCDKTYTSNRNVKRHMEMIHVEKKYYNCHFCPKFYNSNHSLTRHFKSVHCTTDSASNQEDYENSDQGDYENVDNTVTQSETYSPETDLICKCGIKFEEEPLLRDHIKNYHSFETYYEYGMNFLKQHSKRFEDFLLIDIKGPTTLPHEKNMHKDNILNKIFVQSKMKQKQILHPCKFCDKTFTYLCSLEFHTKIFHAQNQCIDTKRSTSEEHQLCSYKCTFCDRKYYSDRSLKHHMKLKHTTDEAVECGLCGKICSNKYYLNAHLKMSHNNDNILQCDHCEKQFRTKRNIRRHIENTHLGKQRYKCLDCQLLFKEKRNLRKHVRSKHIDSILFPHCQFCNKVFESAKACKIHLKLVHSYSISSHPCDFCSESFERYSQLNTHLKTKHLSKDVLYKCEKCNLLFNEQEKLDKHDIIHCNSNKKEILPHCIICVKDFRTYKTLRRHIRKFHLTFNVDELVNYGNNNRNFHVDCEECIKTFNDDSYYTYLKSSDNYNTENNLFSCDFCGNSYTSLEYMIQRYRNNDNCNGQAILSELCTAEMSEEELLSDEKEVECKIEVSESDDEE